MTMPRWPVAGLIDEVEEDVLVSEVFGAHSLLTASVSSTATSSSGQGRQYDDE